MLRQGVWVFAIWASFSSIIYAIDNKNEALTEKFLEAQNLVTQGKIKRAITAYESLIDLNPQIPEAYNNLAALYLQQKNTKKAKFILEKGLSAHKGYGALYENLTAINMAMAREAYSKALQIDLKPADVAIQSLALINNSDKQSNRKKNTIIISKTNISAGNNSVVNNPVENKAETKLPQVNTRPPEANPANRISKNTPPADTRQTVNNEDIETVILAWAAAWSAQTVNMYLSFYHDQFKPANGVLRQRWEKSRSLRLKKPRWIKVGLSDFNIEKNDGRQAIVKFKQLYQSDYYRDVSSKRMVLLYTDSGWRIYQEKSL